MKIGQRVKAVREAQQPPLSQNRLAQRAGIAQGYLSQIEAGEREPSYPTIKRIARALGVSLTALDPDLTEADVASPNAVSKLSIEVGAA